MIAGFVRGLSTGDVETSLAEALGPQAALSRSTVSRICEAIGGEFTAWSARSLAEIELDQLYLDGTCVRYHPASRGWRGLTYTPTATRLLQDLRRELFRPHTDQPATKPVTTAA